MNAMLVAALLAPVQPSLVTDDSTLRLTEAEVAFRAGVDARGDAVSARRHFKNAADGFDRHWREGNRSALLAVQRGRSHFLAGNLPMAVVAFRAGLRETPYDLALLNGLAECRAAIPYPTPARPDEQLRPDPPRGWRHRVSEWDVFRLALVAAALVVIGLGRQFTVGGGWAAWVVAGMGGAAALVCLFVSLITQGEHSAEMERPTLVVTLDTTLRRGNGLTHLPRIEATVPRGTEVTERTRRGGWVQVDVAGGAVGWLPESAVIVIE